MKLHQHLFGNGKPLRCNAWAKPRRCACIMCIYIYMIIYIYQAAWFAIASNGTFSSRQPRQLLRVVAICRASLDESLGTCLSVHLQCLEDRARSPGCLLAALPLPGLGSVGSFCLDPLATQRINVTPPPRAQDGRVQRPRTRWPEGI